jgi:hypothetical protein
MLKLFSWYWTVSGDIAGDSPKRIIRYPIHCVPCVFHDGVSRIVPCRYCVLNGGCGCTYAGELGAAVTALGDSATLLDVQKTQVTTGGLDDTSPVGSGVVAVAAAVGNSVGHHCCESAR